MIVRHSLAAPKNATNQHKEVVTMYDVYKLEYKSVVETGFVQAAMQGQYSTCCTYEPL